MRALSTSLLLVAVLQGYACADVGVFAGTGQNIHLSTNADVQMVSQDVSIIPGRGRFLFDGSVAGMDVADYRCTFQLRNESEREVKLQVGFPLNSQFLRAPYKSSASTVELVASYKFLVQESERIYSVRYEKATQQASFENVFLWDMTFSANEVKTLDVSYSLPISMSLSRTFRDGTKSSYDRPWYSEMEACVVEYFGYVTETARSWKGNVESAKLTIQVSGFETYLNQRGTLERPSGDERQGAYPILQKPEVFRSVSPEGWTKDSNGSIHWESTDSEPDAGVVVAYSVLRIPKSDADTRILLRHLFKTDPTQDDIRDLEDMIREYHGQKTENRRIKAFLENQIWYPKSESTEIPEEPMTVLKQVRERLQKKLESGK
jgi:hypothetical protein